MQAPVSSDMSTAGDSVRVHLRLLRCCGFCRAPRTAAHARSHDAYRTIVLAVTATYLAQECIYAYQERADMDKLARVMFLLLCHVTSIVKQAVFYVDADRIDRIVDGLDEPLYNPGGARAQALMAHTANGAARVLRAYSGAAVVTCTLWIVFPVLYYVSGGAVEVPFWVFFDYGHPFRFSMVMLYSYYATTLVGIGNTSMDAFIATVLNQCKTQLRILRMNFEDLPERARAASARPGGGGGGGGGGVETYEEALDRLFQDCLTHYKNIYETMKTLQDTFGLAILVQFGIGGWILCMAAYKIVSLNVLSIEFASMILFICCILTELFLYCFYGNEVTVESSRVVQSIYCMRWAATPVRFRRSLLVAMERARRPLKPAAGLVVPLSLETFLKILKSSYTFYAVLRQTK